MGTKPFGLSELVFDVKLTLQSKYELPVWVVAEISDLNINRTGHCYLELIEKDTLSDKIIAKARATIWSFAFRTIKPYFETTTGESLRAGLKVLLKVSVEFHEVYGFSLNIQDVDPKYTMGDLARKRAEIIEQLENDGVLEMNRYIPLARVPQRIAVISSETAAGFGDFKDQLIKNQYNYRFYVELFPAIMQGDKSANSIINALNLIFEKIEQFDAVVIIRGGGAKSDLSCFDNYDLAFYITQFPLPVLSGIGHERDDTVVDIVSHTRLKTPTAVAEFLINKASIFDSSLHDFQSRLTNGVNRAIENSEHYLNETTHYFNHTVNALLDSSFNRIEHNIKVLQKSALFFLDKKQSALTHKKNKIELLSNSFIAHEKEMLAFRTMRLKKWIKNYCKSEQKRLELLNAKLELVNPENILKRGYALAIKDGEILKDTHKLNVGDSVTVKLNKGQFDSSIDKING